MTQSSVICPRCGGPRRRSDEECAYCGTFFEQEIIRKDLGNKVEPGRRGRGVAPTAPAREMPAHYPEPEYPSVAAAGEELVDQNVMEPNEAAFALTIPQGWLWNGGITRMSTMMGMSSTFRLDYSVMSDLQASQIIRWLPDIYYYQPMNLMSMMQGGMRMPGIPTLAVKPAAKFFMETVFPQVHPQASQMVVNKTQPLPGVMAAMQQEKMMNPTAAGFTHDAAMLTVTYQDTGGLFTEKALVIVENMGPMSNGMWRNRNTLYFRSWAGTLEDWLPAFQKIISTVQLNPQWVYNELVGQMARGQMPPMPPMQVNAYSQQLVMNSQHLYAQYAADLAQP